MTDGEGRTGAGGGAVERATPLAGAKGVATETETARAGPKSVAPEVAGEPAGGKGTVAEPETALADQLIEIDLATVEKLPVLGDLLAGAEGPALDLGSGLAYYARRLLTRSPPVVVADLDLTALAWAGPHVLRCRADAARLPFRAASFGVVLLADVLEHCPQDRPVLAEIHRVLAPGGRLVLTVPSLEWGFPDFLSLLGIPSVHDQEGPERHHTPGYTRSGLGERLSQAGLEVVEIRDIFRLGPKVLLDSLAVAHLVVERLGRRRRSWTWGHLVAAPPPGLGLYRRLFPLVRGARNLLHRASPRKGFELAVAARRPASSR
jgi:SAM-dependent methyltransferase